VELVPDTPSCRPATEPQSQALSARSARVHRHEPDPRGERCYVYKYILGICSKHIFSFRPQPEMFASGEPQRARHRSDSLPMLRGSCSARAPQHEGGGVGAAPSEIEKVCGTQPKKPAHFCTGSSPIEAHYLCCQFIRGQRDYCALNFSGFEVRGLCCQYIRGQLQERSSK